MKLTRRKVVLGTSHSSMDSYGISDVEAAAGSPAPRSEEDSSSSRPPSVVGASEGDEFDVDAYVYEHEDKSTAGQGIVWTHPFAHPPPPRSSTSLPRAKPSPSLPLPLESFKRDPGALANLSRAEREAKVRQMRLEHGRQKREREQQRQGRAGTGLGTGLGTVVGKAKKSARPVPPPLPLTSPNEEPTPSSSGAGSKMYSVRRKGQAQGRSSTNHSAGSLGTVGRNASLQSFHSAKDLDADLARDRDRPNVLRKAQPYGRTRSRSRSSSIDSTGSKRSFFSVRSTFSLRSLRSTNTKKLVRAHPVPHLPGPTSTPPPPPPVAVAPVTPTYAPIEAATSRRIPPPSPTTPVSLASSSWASPIFDHPHRHDEMGLFWGREGGRDSAGSVTPATTPEMTYDEKAPEGATETEEDDEEVEQLVAGPSDDRDADGDADGEEDDDEEWKDAEEDSPPRSRVASIASFSTAFGLASLPVAEKDPVPPLPASGLGLSPRRKELDDLVLLGALVNHRRSGSSAGRLSLGSSGTTSKRSSAQDKDKDKRGRRRSAVAIQRPATAGKEGQESEGDGDDFEDAEEEPEWMGDEASFGGAFPSFPLSRFVIDGSRRGADLDKAVALSREARRMSAQAALSSAAESRQRYSLLAELSTSRNNRPRHGRQASLTSALRSSYGTTGHRTTSTLDHHASLGSVEETSTSEGQPSPVVPPSPLSEGQKSTTTVPLFTRHASLRSSGSYSRRGSHARHAGSTSRRGTSVSAASSTGTVSTGESAAAPGWKPRPMLLRASSTSRSASPMSSPPQPPPERILESPEVEEVMQLAAEPFGIYEQPSPLSPDLSLLPREPHEHAFPALSDEGPHAGEDFGLQASLASLNTSMQELALVSPPRSRRPSMADSVLSNPHTDAAAALSTRLLPALDELAELDGIGTAPVPGHRAALRRSRSCSATHTPRSLSFDAQEAATLLASGTSTRRLRADSSVARLRNASVSTCSPDPSQLGVVQEAVIKSIEPVETATKAPLADFAMSTPELDVPWPDATLAVPTSPVALTRALSPISVETTEAPPRKKGFKLKSLFRSRSSLVSPPSRLVALPPDLSTKVPVDPGSSFEDMSSHKSSARLDLGAGDLSSFGKIFSADERFDYLPSSVKVAPHSNGDSSPTNLSSPKSRQSRLINAQRDIADLDRARLRTIRGRSVAIGGPVRMSTQEESTALWRMIGGRARQSKRG